jgi:hypothetical protein
MSGTKPTSDEILPPPQVLRPEAAIGTLGMSPESFNSEKGVCTNQGSQNPAAVPDDVENMKGRADSCIEYPGQHGPFCPLPRQLCSSFFPPHYLYISFLR